MSNPVNFFPTSDNSSRVDTKVDPIADTDIKTDPAQDQGRTPFPKVRTIDRKMVDAVNQMSHRPSDKASLTISHSYLNRRFSYNVADLCDQEYEPLSGNASRTTVHLCLYQVNTEVPTNPFLGFALEQKQDISPGVQNPLPGDQGVQNPLPGDQGHPSVQTPPTGPREMLQFPTIEFSFAESEGGNPTAQLTSACYQRMFEILAVEPTPDTTVEHIASLTQFRGIYSDPNGDQYAFFEISPAHTDKMVASKHMTWATIHEIVNTQRVRAVPVSPATQAVFVLEPEFMYIKDEIGVPVDIPFVLYASRMSGDGSFFLEPKATVFVPQYEHPFGYYSFFSDYGDQNVETTVPRYIVFTDNILYLVGTEEENQKMYERTLANMHFSGIYFQDKTGVPRWGVRTVDAYMRFD